VSREVGVNLRGHTTTKTGVAIRSALDENHAPTGREVTAQQMESLAIKQEKFHGAWNDTSQPRM
jgi:DDE family transposase